MAEAVSSGSVRSNASRENADSPEKGAAEDDAELFQCLMQQKGTTEEKNAELVAEAEAVVAGWMLDFLCLSLCRAFRDGRSEDFHRTRDSAEGECGPPGPRLRRAPRPAFLHVLGRDHRREAAASPRSPETRRFLFTGSPRPTLAPFVSLTVQRKRDPSGFIEG